jgi:hypothetical protein
MDTNTPQEPSTSWWTGARKRAAICAAVALVAAVAGAVLILGHGGSATASGGNPAAGGPGFGGGGPGFAPSGGATDDSLDQFRQCLQKNGVRLPDRSQGGGRPNFDDSTMRKAIEACQQYAPNRGGGFGGPPDSQRAPNPTPATPAVPDGSTT